MNFKNVARCDGSGLVLVEDYEINRKKFTFMARSATRSPPSPVAAVGEAVSGQVFP